LVTVVARRTVAVAFVLEPVDGRVGFRAAHTLNPEVALVAVVLLSPRTGI